MNPIQHLTQSRAVAIMLRGRTIRWALIDQALVSGTNFATSIVLARTLTPTGFGAYTLGWLVIQFFASMQLALVITPMMTLAPQRDRGSIGEYYGAVLIQQLAFTLLGFASIASLSLLGGHILGLTHLASIALPLAAMAAAFFNQDYVRRVLLVEQRHRVVFIVDSIAYLGQLAMILVLRPNLSVPIALWVVSGAFFTALCISLRFLPRPAFTSRAIRGAADRHWRFAKWLLGASLLQWTSGNYLTVAASATLGTAAAGALRACQNIMGLNHVVFLGLENVLPARAASILKDRGRPHLLADLRRIGSFGALPTFLISLVVFAWPSEVLALVYGDTYSANAPLLRFFAVFYLLLYANLPLRVALRTIESTKPIFVAYIATSAVSLVIARPAIAQFGLTGVGLGLVVLQLLTGGIYLAALRSTLSSKQ